MLVIFSCCHKDADLALKQAQWIKELGGVTKHDAILACNAETVRRKLHLPIVDALSSAFNFVEVFTPRDEVEDGWPKSPNHMWVRCIQYVRDHKKDAPLLWMEADAVPTVSTWVDQGEGQFLACRKPFMGDYVELEGILPHMSGVAFYHRTSYEVPPFASVEKTAWDVALAMLILPKFHRTKLIQHEWKPAPFATADDLKRVRPEAVIYHQCKDGSLIDRLREARGGVAVARPVHLREVVSSTLAPATPSPEVAELKAEIERLKALIKPESNSRRKAGKRHRKPMTPEQKKAAQENLARARAKKASMVSA